jgi:F-type H+-transporting ATPase subunit b
MNRDHRSTRTAPLLAAAATLLAAVSARAADGGLVLVPDPVMLPLLVVIFGALVYPVNQLILKPIFRVLDEREQKIAGTRRRAEKLAADAEEVLQRYQQAIDEARQEAERARKQALEEARNVGGAATSAARGEAEGQVGHARAEVAAALGDARSALRSQSQELAREIASRALGRTLS